MQNQSCIVIIRHKYDMLTPAEKKIADYILHNSSQIPHMSISHLAQTCSVAKSAVLRFCKTLGFPGYPALKIALSADLAQNSKFNFTPYIDPEDTSLSILDKIFAAGVKTLHLTAQNIDRITLDNIICAMDNAKCIYVFGIGTSAALCYDFQYRLIQVGKTALCFTDVPSMKVSTLNIGSSDFAIGISHSGRTIPTIDALKLAQEKGATTACLTSFPHSPIISACDFPISIYSDEVNYPMEALSSRIAHISVMDTIAVSLSSKHYEDAVERALHSRQYIETIRYRGKI